MTSGRNKGMQFERDICVSLSLWWTNGKDDDVFWRSDASGGRATNRAKRGKTTSGQYGDVAAINPSGSALIRLTPLELKKGYPKVSVHDLLDHLPKQKPPVFWEWVQQAQAASDASPTAIGWLLITGRTRRKALLWMPGNIREALSRHGSFLDKLPIRLYYKKQWIYGMQFEEFCRVVSPDTFRRYL